MDKPTEIVTALAASVASLAGASAPAGERMDKILRPDKPQLSAADAATLHAQLRNFKVYLNEAQEVNKSRWFRAARAIATGKARTCLEGIIVQEIGGEAEYQALLREPKHARWNSLWDTYESKLKQISGLDDSSELNFAVQEYGRVVLPRGASLHQLEDFVQSYSNARIRMIEHGLLADGDPKLVTREIEDLKNKMQGSAVLAYLLQLPEFPTAVDSNDATEAKKTILGRIRQHIAAHRAPGSASHHEIGRAHV